MWSLRLEPAARGPRRGVRGHRGPGPGAARGRLQRRPTKPVYAVVERPPSEDESAEPPSASCARSRWGLVPSWAKDPSIGNRMINARMETVADKPAFRRAFASRRCLLPADGYFEWYPTEAAGRAGKPLKQPFFIRPRTAGCSRWPGSTRSGATPPRPRTTPSRSAGPARCITTEAEDALGHIHDRMPLMVERDRWDAWLDPRRARGRAARPADAGGPGPARGVPGLEGGRQRPQQRPRARRAAARSRARSDGRADALSTRRTVRPGWSPAARRARGRRCCSATAPATASTPGPEALATALPAHGRHRRALRAAVAGRRAARSPRPRRRSTTACAPPPTRCGCGPRWWWAAGRRVPVPPPGTARGAGRRRLPRARVPAAPAGPPGADPARRAAGVGRADAGRPGRARHDRPARRVPRRPRPHRRTRRRPRARGPQARPGHPGRGARRSSSSRCWSGWSATSSAEPGMSGEPSPAFLLRDRHAGAPIAPRPRATSSHG